MRICDLAALKRYTVNGEDLSIGHSTLMYDGT